LIFLPFAKYPARRSSLSPEGWGWEPTWHWCHRRRGWSPRYARWPSLPASPHHRGSLEKKHKTFFFDRQTLKVSCAVYLSARLMIDTLISFFYICLWNFVYSPGQTTKSGSRAIVPQRRPMRSSRVCPWLRNSRSSVSIEYETPLYISSFKNSSRSKNDVMISIVQFLILPTDAWSIKLSKIAKTINKSYRHLW